MTKIFFIKISLDPGGAEKQLLLLSNMLAINEKLVFVAYQNAHPDLLTKFSSQIIFYRLPSNKILQCIKLWLFLRHKKIDVIQAWDLGAGMIALLASFFNKAKFINGSLRSAPSEYFFKNDKTMRRYLQFAHLCKHLNLPILSNSYAGLRAYQLESYKKSHVLYNGYQPIVNPEKTEDTDSDNVLRIGMVANMRWKKDFQSFIETGLKIIPEHPNVLFYLIGDGPDKAKYIQIVKDNPFKNNFVFTGYTGNANHYIQGLDIGVLLNDASGEGLSNSIMEYMAYGKPVIATALGGNPELVSDNETGFLIPPRQVQILAEKICLLIQNKSERLRLGANGKKRLEQYFSPEKMISNYNVILNTILN